MNIIKFDPGKSWLSWPTWDDLSDNLQRGLKIRETEKEIIIDAVVAGVPSNNVEVNIENGILTIKAQGNEEGKEESLYYSYYYTTALSGGQWDQATAEVENGIVVVKIPKEEKAKARKIEVKAKGK